MQIGAFGCDPATDHFGNGAGDHHRGQLGIQRFVGTAHGAFGAIAPELFLTQTGHHNGQLVRGQGVGVVQHAGDRQVFATHRAVDDDLHAFDGGEHIHRPPISTGAVVIKDEGQGAHGPISSALRFLASFSA